MTFVITQPCCNDAACVPTCPVDAIHPAPGEPGYMTTEMLYIDGESCIDCSACVQVCPVNAIVAEEDLTEDNRIFLDINASFFQSPPSDEPAPATPKRPGDVQGLRVAVVGSGPAGSYAAAELLSHRGVDVDVYERLLTPYGLIRAGVAPDHGGTKAVTDSFPYRRPPAAFRTFFGVEVGRDITHEELAAAYHAVIYAVGAPGDRRLGIDGEDLPGSHSAREFVAWYNGHPEAADLGFDLSAERAVIVGNGNVALDVARILATSPERLAHTDIAAHALRALHASKIREVVVVGRRGPGEAAYTSAEIIGLMQRADLDVHADPEDVARALQAKPSAVTPLHEWKWTFAEQMARGESAGIGRKVMFRYLASPVAVEGLDRMTGLRLRRNDLVEADGGALVARPTDEEFSIDAGLVFRSVGYFGAAVPGLPFDDSRGVIPHAEGRVLSSEDETVRKAYVTGWIKRGPSGVIGTNRQCASETVQTVMTDFTEGLLDGPTMGPDAVAALVRERVPDSLTLEDWARIDAAEVALGRRSGRPREKLVTTEAMREAVALEPSRG